MLSTNLARAPGLRVVSAMRAQELLRGVARNRDTTAGTIAIVAREAGAGQLVDGALYKLAEGRYRLDLRRTDLANGAVLSAHAVEGADVFALVDSGTHRLVAALGSTAPAGSIADVTTRSVVAYRLYADGLRAYYGGNTSAAHDLFTRSTAEDSTFALAAYYRALTETPPDRVGPALSKVVHLAERASDRERLIIRAGWADATSSPSLQAIAETLATRYPAEVQGPLYLGTALLRAGDFMGAIPHFERALRMDSLALGPRAGQCGACLALAGVVQAYSLADSGDAALRVSRRWTRQQPASPMPRFVVAGGLQRLGRVDEALAAYRTGLALDTTIKADPTYPAVLALTAYRFTQADPLLRALAESPATRRDAFGLLTISLRMQGRMREALEYARRYRRASMESGIPDAQSVAFAFHEAQVLLEAGRHGEAAALFDSLARIPMPSGERSRRARQRVWNLTHAADARAEVRDTVTLRAYADTVRIEGPHSGYGRDSRLHHHVSGLLLRVRGDDAAASREFRDAIYSLSLGYTRSNLELARALLRLGRGAEAVTPLQAALRSYLDGANLYVTRTELQEALGDAWVAAGRADSAAASYRIVARAWAAGDPAYRARAARADSLARRLGQQRR